MPKTIQIVLEADTALFLEIARVNKTPKAISNFINSLLRQECFRQGYVVESSSRPPSKKSWLGAFIKKQPVKGKVLPFTRPR